MCPDIQEWHMSLYAARELTGIVRWPIYCMCWSVRDFAEALKSRFFCYQCGWLICKRVERDFCSEKCAKEFLPFQSKGARRSGTDGYADRLSPVPSFKCQWGSIAPEPNLPLLIFILPLSKTGPHENRW